MIRKTPGNTQALTSPPESGWLVVIIMLVTAACAMPTWAQVKTPRIGVLTVADQSQLGWERYLRAFRDHGLITGKNVVIELRTGGGNPRQMDKPASELVAMKVDVLFAVGPSSVRAAFAATRTLPIVAHDLETDPVAAGYATTYSRPGGNLTGLFLDSPDLSGKSLELLKMVVPKLSRVAVLWDATSGPVPLAGIRSVAPRFGVKLQVLEIHSPEEIDDAAARFRDRPQALIVLPSPMMYYQRVRLAKLAQAQRLPASSMFVAFAEAGGLMGYGPEIPATLDQCAELIAKVLSGTRPGEIPIQRPSKFEFVFNQKAAKALGLTAPPAVVMRADRVIQ